MKHLKKCKKITKETWKSPNVFVSCHIERLLDPMEFERLTCSLIWRALRDM